jgi:quercetin dioxygenase-like cupin family protein
MPIYKIADMPAKKGGTGGSVSKTVVGELIKAAIVTYQDGEGPMPHVHNNEEQYILMLEGRMRMILGDVDEVIAHGDLVHIPRGVRHGSRALGPVAFFAVKSPVGNGDMAQDSKRADDADDVARRLASVE